MKNRTVQDPDRSICVTGAVMAILRPPPPGAAAVAGCDCGAVSSRRRGGTLPPKMYPASSLKPAFAAAS
jgi:hypothetical protein